MKRVALCCMGMIVGCGVASAAPPATEPSGSPSGSPQPEYPVAYHIPQASEIAQTLVAVRGEVERSCTPPTASDSAWHVRGGFNPLSYPMGVAYAGMLAAATATGDKGFAEFDAVRFQQFADYVAKESGGGGESETPERGPVAWRHLTNPASLDDCGAVGAAFVKARRAGVGPDLMPVIDRFAKYVSSGQFRLEDGTVARKRPFAQSVWGDDMYMSVPLLAQMGALTKDGKYFDDAAKQVMQLGDKLWVPEKKLFTHAWNAETGKEDQPHYFWGRANGWCMMATVELLEVMPADHPQRGAILKRLREQAEGVASLQGSNGLWHQLLDQNDSYYETSCSAMFCFAMARGVNRGWLDADAYGPVALAGWNGVCSRISADGHVTGTCIGTSYADDAIYYTHRPAVDDVHGYGPVLMAGAEMIELLKNQDVQFLGGGRGTPIMVRRRG